MNFRGSASNTRCPPGHGLCLWSPNPGPRTLALWVESGRLSGRDLLRMRRRPPCPGLSPSGPMACSDAPGPEQAVPRGGPPPWMRRVGAPHNQAWTAQLDSQTVAQTLEPVLSSASQLCPPGRLCDFGQVILPAPRLSPLCLEDKQLPAPLGGSNNESPAWLAAVVLEELIIEV